MQRIKYCLPAVCNILSTLSNVIPTLTAFHQRHIQHWRKKCCKECKQNIALGQDVVLIADTFCSTYYTP